MILTSSSLKLAAKGRLKFDKVRGQHLLLLPERVVVLNQTAAQILALCDGKETVHTITDKMRSSLKINIEKEEEGLPNIEKIEEDITEFLRNMLEQGWVVIQDDRFEEK